MRNRKRLAKEALELLTLWDLLGAIEICKELGLDVKLPANKLIEELKRIAKEN